MAATDKYASYTNGISSCAVGGFSITPHAVDEIAYLTRGVMVATMGNVDAVMMDGTTVVLPALQPGVLYPFRIRAVRVAGTTATGIVGVY